MKKETYNNVPIRKYGINFELDYDKVKYLDKIEIVEYVELNVVDTIIKIEDKNNVNLDYHVEIEDMTDAYIDFDIYIGYTTLNKIYEELLKLNIFKNIQMIFYFDDECIMSSFDDFNKSLIKQTQEDNKGVKLFELYYIDEYDVDKYLTVGSSADEVEKRESKILKRDCSFFNGCHAVEVKEVDGYKITVSE